LHGRRGQSRKVEHHRENGDDQSDVKFIHPDSGSGSSTPILGINAREGARQKRLGGI
jgi:hypothetical protein